MALLLIPNPSWTSPPPSVKKRYWACSLENTPNPEPKREGTLLPGAAQKGQKGHVDAATPMVSLERAAESWTLSSRAQVSTWSCIQHAID